MKSSYYLTSAIPYVNAKPHLGHLLEWFQADTVARWQRQIGKQVSFTCGTDENSLKNVQAAEKAGVQVQEWLDTYAVIFRKAFEDFNISITHFNRGSDQVHHWPGVQELWNRCVSAGDVYQKLYSGKYCVGCETFYTDEELSNGLCPEHLKPPEIVTETNYFFSLSNYQKQLEELISSNSVVIANDQYKNEVLGFIRGGLEDFSISRTTKRARGLGVPVPGDDSQIMYVWFDALSIYLTAIGWNYNITDFEHIWPCDVHYIGKGILRFHAVYWLAMLLSAKLPLPKAIAVHGYITVEGQKMSKSLGNVLDPYDVISEFGLEPIRYFLLRGIATHADGDFSKQRFNEIYTAELANGVGNLCSRIAKLLSSEKESLPIFQVTPDPTFVHFMDTFSLDEGLSLCVSWVAELDHWLAEKKPWKSEGDERLALLIEARQKLLKILFHLQPFIPETADNLYHHFQQPIVVALQPIFPRLS